MAQDDPYRDEEWLYFINGGEIPSDNGVEVSSPADDREGESSGVSSASRDRIGRFRVM